MFLAFNCICLHFKLSCHHDSIVFIISLFVVSCSHYLEIFPTLKSYFSKMHLALCSYYHYVEYQHYFAGVSQMMNPMVNS